PRSAGFEVCCGRGSPIDSPFFCNRPATTEIYTLSLHDALPICPHRARGYPPGSPRERKGHGHCRGRARGRQGADDPGDRDLSVLDRKSTRLNSSHVEISYAVFCLKKKNEPLSTTYTRLSTTNYT